jgi:hypothetical protein
MTMAKRKRSYSGTPEKHRGIALKAAKGIRGTLTRARGFLAAGNCKAALNSLKTAEWASGLYIAHASETVDKRNPMSFRRPWKEYGTSQARAVTSMWKKFATKCMR